MTENTQAHCLMTLLKYALKGKQMPQAKLEQLLKEADGDALYALARAHAVASLICEEWSAYPGLQPSVGQRLQSYTTQIISHSYRLLFYTKYLVGLLEEEGLSVAVLKGVSTAEFYPQPELRKSGDVDLLFFSGEDCVRAVACLKKHGLTEHNESVHVHHIGMQGAEGIQVELHSMMVEPFDNEVTNRTLLRLQKEAMTHIRRQSCMGVPLPVLSGEYHGCSLLLHLLQHFLTAGFGIKLLCDWVVFWDKQPPEVTSRMVEMIHALKVEQFAAVVTGVCVQKLGMENAATEAFLALGEPEVLAPAYLERFFQDIIEAEEFGKSDSGRMVAIHESGLSGYIRAFHHQMKLNYPKAGNYFFLWPALWVSTLLRFLHNNRTLRGTTVVEVLKSAAKRGEIVDKMHLFE